MADSATIDYAAQIGAQMVGLASWVESDESHKSLLDSTPETDFSGMTRRQIRESLDSDESVSQSDVDETKAAFLAIVESHGVNFVAQHPDYPRKPKSDRAKQNRPARASVENSLSKSPQSADEILALVNGDPTVTEKVEVKYVASVLQNLKSKDKASREGRASETTWTSFVPVK